MSSSLRDSKDSVPLDTETEVIDPYSASINLALLGLGVTKETVIDVDIGKNPETGDSISKWLVENRTRLRELLMTNLDYVGNFNDIAVEALL